jgi:hypothetical protein
LHISWAKTATTHASEDAQKTAGMAKKGKKKQEREREGKGSGSENDEEKK